jgi:mannose-6-phosphate isomerase
MLVPLSNEPRDYAWGSTTLIAELAGREPSGRPEAEVWLGDHPADPAAVPDGRTLDAWILAEGADHGMPGRLPYLLKLLAAASALSIQAHPSKTQAEAGFAREEAAGIARDAAERTYRDANHKPELIVAVSDTFRALAGVRELDATRRLVGSMGAGAQPLAEALDSADASPGPVLSWVLSQGGRSAARDIVDAALSAHSDEFAAELQVVRELDRGFPGDPGIVVALLLNLVTLRRGEGLFVPAGIPHAYLDGLGVELMAASDNVLRGGLTPKHIDVAELLDVLDPTPGPLPVLRPEHVAAGLERFAVPVADFALFIAEPSQGAAVTLGIDGAAIALCTAGEVTMTGADVARETLRPGGAVLATPDEGAVTLTGDGRVFIAVPGR